MAEEFTGTKKIEDPVKPDQQKLETNPQDNNLSPSIGEETVEVLDKWFAEQVEKAKNPDEGAGDAGAGEGDGKEGEGEGEGDDAGAGEGEGEGKSEGEGSEGAEGAEGEGDADGKSGDAPADGDGDDSTAGDDDSAKTADKPDDDFNKIELPANARGKSAEAFAAIKERANAQITTLNKELEASQSRIAELQGQLEGTKPLTDDVQKELDSLREFKIKLDIEADPKFYEKYDGKIASLETFVFDKLAETGKLTENGLNKIKEMGVTNVDWEDLFEKLGDPKVKRLLQSQIDEITVIEHERQKHLHKAKTNVRAYIEEQRKEYQKQIDEHQTATTKELDDILPKLPWLVEEPKPLPTTATPDEKLVWEDNKKFRDEVKGCLSEALNDNSPNMRAVLIAGMAQLLKLRKDYAITTEAFKQSEEARKQAEEKLAKIKKASVARTKEKSAAPPTDSRPKPTVNFTTSAGDAIDALAKEAGYR